MIYYDTHAYDLAIYYLQQSLALYDTHVENWNFLGSLYMKKSLPIQSLLCYYHVLRLKPDHIDAKVNRCIMMFAIGDFKNGWHFFEDRWLSKSLSIYMQDIPSNKWKGEGLSGRDLLVLDEQGVGDMLMFYSLLKPLERDGVRLHVQCKSKIEDTIKNSISTYSCNEYNTNNFIKKFPNGYITRCGEIAGIMGLYTSKNHSYKPEPWLNYDVAQAMRLRDNISHLAQGKFVVGLSWYSKHKEDTQQNISLEAFLPLFTAFPNIYWVNLQYGDHQEEIEAFEKKYQWKLHRFNHIDPYANPSDAIALTAACDFIITTENTASHFAGVIGKKTFLLLSKSCTWRWTWRDDDNQHDQYLWYKNHHLVRQHKTHDTWDITIENLTKLVQDEFKSIYKTRENIDHIQAKAIDKIEQNQIEDLTDEDCVLYHHLPTYYLGYIVMGAKYYGEQHYDLAYYYLKLAQKVNEPYNLLFYSLLANTCLYLYYNDEAIALYKIIIEQEPIENSGFAINNLSMIYLNLAQFDKAEELSKMAIKHDYGHADQYTYNLSNIYIAQRRFKEAWDIYDSRFATPKFNLFRRNYDIPMWQGEDLTGKKLLIQSEQGVGEQIMFASFLPYFDTSATAYTALSCKHKLESLFARSLPYPILPHGQGNEHAYAHNDAYDYYIPMGSVMKYIHLFHNPAIKPKAFLQTDPEKTLTYQKLLYEKAQGRKIVGISWYKRISRINSMSIETLFPLAKRDDLLLVNLQYESSPYHIARLNSFNNNVLSLDDIDNYDDVEDLCALIKACHYVVSIQNSTVHFAGALGVKTHVMLPKSVDWRWSNGYKKGLWYEDVTLHYQKTLREWGDVVDHITQLL